MAAHSFRFTMNENMPAKVTEEQPWAAAYRLALFEENMTRLPDRIAAARSAISIRIADLGSSIDRGNDVESLKGALKVLRLLEREFLGVFDHDTRGG